MKKALLLFTALCLTGITVNAENTTKIDNHRPNYNRNYGNSFIFNVEGIEFSVFPDGQFDFYMPNYGPNVNVSGHNSNVSISFNSGYDYGSYVQYDEFGAIIQIERIPIYYDFYGRIVQAGNVYINYNRHGYISRVGGLYVHYNRSNRFSHCSGYINRYNRGYVYRPWHSYYRVPAFDYCVVYNRPYRQHYKPVRHHYKRPYRNNSRRRTAVASRRGNKVTRDRHYATVVKPRRNNQQSTPRPRKNVSSPRPRTNTNQSTPRPKRNTTTPSPRTNTNQSTPRPKRNTTTPRPRTNTNQSTPRPRRSVTQSKPRTNSKKNTSQSRRSTTRTRR